MRVFEKYYQGFATEEGGGGMEGKLNGNYLKLTRAVSRGQNELTGKFKMVAGDVISIKGQVIEYLDIPTGIKSELVRFCVELQLEGVSCRDCWRRNGCHLF